VTEVLKAVVGVEDVELSTTSNGAGLELRPDRQLGSRYGVPANTIGRTVSAALSERAVTRLRNRNREIEVVLRLEGHDRNGIGDLMGAKVRRRGGGASGPAPVAAETAPLPIRSLVSLHKTPSPREIKRVDRNAVVSVEVSVAEGQEVRTVTGRVEKTMAALSLPRGISWKLDTRVRRWRSGESENSSSALLAFLLVLMLLAALFESYVEAIVIAITVPFALVGVAWAFWATDTKLDSMAWIGLMILIGIVVNHGIVLVDRVRRIQDSVDDPLAVLVRAGRERMRPIVMTAATTVLGLLPIVGQHLFPETFSADSGARVYGPIGLAVASGLVVSTGLTLLVLPAALAVTHDLRTLARRVLHPEDVA
jgi:HAE1 family hydrophobic/amphiphilic exporter-1